MEYIRLLFWLKWKLMWRGYSRNTVALLGVIFALLFFLPLAIGAAIGTAIGYRLLDSPYDAHLLRAVLLGIYLLWILGPLLGYTLNESYDITKLFLYPFSSRQFFTGAIFGALMDFPVLIVLPVLLAVFVGFFNNLPAVLLVTLSVLLFLFHTISVSQTLLLAGAGFLRSRRYRDIMMVVGPLLAILFYLSFQILPRQAITFHYRTFVESRGWEIVNYLPSGLAARAIAAASTGDYLVSLAFLLLLAGIAVATLFLAGRLIDMVATGVVISGPAVSTVKRRKSFHPRERSAVGLRLPPVMAAVIEKEVKYYLRDPYFKTLIVNTLYMLAIFVLALLRQFDREGFHFTPPYAWSLISLAMLMQIQLTGNLFGMEGSAAATLFTFPSSRRQMFLGKNLIQFALMVVFYSLLVIAICWLGKMADLLWPLLLWVVLVIGILVAVGNITSIYFPMPAVARGWRMQQRSAGQGCGYALVFLGAQGVMLLLLLPPLAALLAPTYWIAPLWYAVTVPLAFVYVFGVYLLSLRLAEPLLLKREIDIAEKLRPQE